MPRAADVMPGTRFGLWTVLNEVERRSGLDNPRIRKLRCRCDCGTTKDIQLSSLRFGSSNSCGCAAKEPRSIAATKHGLSGKPLYRLLNSMKQRCFNPNHHAYQGYGGRGILVCQEWLGTEGAERFVSWALENGYRKGLDIDRADNDKGYSPDNCRWATKQQNANNRRNTKYVEYNGETLPQTECWRRYSRGVKHQTFCDRLKRGIPVDAALRVYPCRYLKMDLPS